MIEIEVKGGHDPKALAELIAATLHGHVLVDPQSPAAAAGRLVRVEQELAELRRPKRDQVETVNFTTLEAEQDWSDL